MFWTSYLPAAALLVAGLLRVRDRSGTRRAVAAALISAGLATALGAQDVAALLASAGMTDATTLTRMFLITAAGAAAFAVARRVALSATLLPWPPAALGMAVGLMQVVLYYTAAMRAGPAAGSPLETTVLPEAAARGWSPSAGRRWHARSCCRPCGPTARGSRGQRCGSPSASPPGA